MPQAWCSARSAISVTLTLDAGDTAWGDFDFNQLTLGLDGINTGLLLNGFSDGATVTATISGAPNNAALILAALQLDGQLAGTIIDSSPNDNFIGIPRVQTTLTINGPANQVIPEPGTAALAAGGLLPLLGVVTRRRFRRSAR